MGKIYSVFIFIGLSLCTSCIIEDANVVVPQHQQEVVVNAFLTPDSLISVSLTYSVNFDEPNTFVPVADAQVIIYDNKAILDTLSYSENGVYKSIFTPAPNHTYDLLVTTTNGQTLMASSTMPPKPVVSIFNLEKLPCRNPDIEYSDAYIVSLNVSQTEPSNGYWFGFLESSTMGICYPGLTKSTYCPVGIMYSADVRLDHFNQQAFPTLSCDGIIPNEFELEALIPKNALLDNNEPIEFITSSLKQNNYYTSIVCASDEYTNYYKSVISNLNYEYGKDDNPFASPRKIYGNITNGLGIFCCYNRTILAVE